MFDPIIYEFILEHQRDKDHKRAVLYTVKKGIYVDNIYKIGLELPSTRDQTIRKPEETKRPFNIKKKHISDMVFSFYCDKKSFDDRSDDTISL